MSRTHSAKGLPAGLILPGPLQSQRLSFLKIESGITARFSLMAAAPGPVGCRDVGGQLRHVLPKFGFSN